MLSFDEVIKGLTPEQIRNHINSITLIMFGGQLAMAKYTGKQSILDEVLGEYADCGFKLEEIGDDELVLYFKDKKIATYNQIKVTIEIIREGCKNYLASILRSL